MDYLALLKHSFEVEKENGQIRSHLDYLSEYIFDFTTYDSDMSELFATKAIEVCSAINNRQTFEYIEDSEDYKWFLLMCNMPFFVGKLEWGTSIRGAWWGGSYPDNNFELQSCGLWVGDEQLADPIKFNIDEWKLFVNAVIEFARYAI